MIGQIITDPKTGEPLDNSGGKLAVSAYQPSKEVKDLFVKVQTDYQVAYALQHRSFKEFDGYSLLDRARLDQETFAAYVGCEWVPAHKRWRWKGRKNTSRNKLIKILARALAGMLYPFVYAKNEEDEEDKMTARVMRILIEDHLRKADYEMNFLFMSLSALVNPAVFVHVEYVEKMQTIKEQLQGGGVKITQVVDELMSGLALNIRPIDEVMLTDFYSGTGKVQQLPAVILIRRIPYDQAKTENAGKYFDESGKDLFDYVQAGMTRIFLAGTENQELFDIEWTEADRDYVQELTIMYRSEDLELKWIGGVGLFNQKDPYNTNPFKHRRMTLVGDDWKSIPIVPVVMSGFEPLDPTGRFAYYKSGAFKEYWDDQALNRMQAYAYDGTALDVMKPILIPGVSSVDSTVMVPGAVVGIPQGSVPSPYQLGPNLAAAYTAMSKADSDMNDSTQSDPVPSTPTPNIPATQTAAAVQQAKLFYSVYALMISDLVKQVGELVMDCTVQHTTVGELDDSVPEALRMKYKNFLVKSKDKGRDITNKIVFSDEMVGRKYTDAEVSNVEWGLYNKSGKTPKARAASDQRIYLINPYQFARTTYTMYVDPDQIIKKSMGLDKQENITAFNMMSDPRVAPFVDMKQVVNDFVIDEYGGSDPDKYKAKQDSNAMLGAIMGPGAPGASPGITTAAPVQAPQLTA